MVVESDGYIALIEYLVESLGLFESQRQGATQERRQLGARSAQLQAEIQGREQQIARLSQRLARHVAAPAHLEQ